MYNVVDNPNGIIHAHDIYTEGQAKDDNFQGHGHKSTVYISMSSGSNDAVDTLIKTGAWVTGLSRILEPSSDNINGEPRYGTVTRGKRKAVYFYMKGL